VKGLAGIRTPDQVTISITEECPNKCIHCALPDSGHKYRLEPDVAKDVIRQVLDLGATLITFDGGEPSLYRELPELVSSVGERAISNMFTSGAGFTPALARSLKETGLYAVNVSIDSPVPEEHDAMRGRFGAFRDAMKAVENALAAGLLVDIYVVIQKSNMKHLSAFHDLARKSGAHELTFFEVVPTGRYTGKTGITLSDVDYAELGHFISTAGSPRIFSVPAALSSFGCFAGRTWLHITPYGQVYPCACLPKNVGSIFEEPISQIWRRMGRVPYLGRKKCPVREGQVFFNAQG
jgi:MoaA/NifB/PqqE/SkfB family radical SAM enzyme